jgi:hypothetical protein
VGEGISARPTRPCPYDLCACDAAWPHSWHGGVHVAGGAGGKAVGGGDLRILAGELLGQPLTVLMPQRFHAAHRAGVERFLATRVGRVIGHTIELAGIRKNGEEFPVELSLAAVPVEEPSPSPERGKRGLM